MQVKTIYKNNKNKTEKHPNLIKKTYRIPKDKARNKTSEVV